MLNLSEAKYKSLVTRSTFEESRFAGYQSCIVEPKIEEDTGLKTRFYRAYARREGIEYIGKRLHLLYSQALEESRLKAWEWKSYEESRSIAVGRIFSGKITAANEQAIAEFRIRSGDRLFDQRWIDLDYWDLEINSFFSTDKSILIERVSSEIFRLINA